MSSGPPFVHHLAIVASDFEATERIFTAALKELAVEAMYRADGIAEYWRPEDGSLSLSVERARLDTSVTRRMHIAFLAPDRAGVDASTPQPSQQEPCPAMRRGSGRNTTPTAPSSATRREQHRGGAQGKRGARAAHEVT